jgi:hypothetical protein
LFHKGTYEYEYKVISPSGDIRAFPKGPVTKWPLKKSLDIRASTFGPRKKVPMTKGPYDKGTW